MRTFLAVLALVLPAVSSAEPVTYHMTGTVDAVTDGSGSSLDLRATFSVGAPITLDLTVERSTPPSVPDANTFIYPNTGMNLVFTIGSYTCTGAAGAGIIITNDLNGFDGFDYSAYTLTAPEIGGASSSIFVASLQDPQGLALDSGVLPRPMPDMPAWATKAFTLTLADPGLLRTGTVSGTFGSVTTPAFAKSWGELKNRYRR